MIRIDDLKPEHVGRRVVYRPYHEPGGSAQAGTITSWNDKYIFVRYGANPGSAATNPIDLEWE